MLTGEQMYDLIRELEDLNEQHREENGRLREVVRAQGEFIQSIKEQIAAFRDHPPVSLGRAIADRGFRG